MIFNQLFSNPLSSFYNLFFPILFITLKYSLAIILISIGVLFLLRLRGFYLKQNSMGLEQKTRY